MVVFASEKDRTNVSAPLHTNFKLQRDGEYLALVKPYGVTVAFEYAAEYPQQYGDISYGLQHGTTTDAIYYFTTPTPGDANQLHCHNGSFWSGVYYVDPGGADDPSGGGELILEDPRFPMAYMTVADLVFRGPDGEPVRSQVAIRPEAGMLVLFPSWVRHSVQPHRGDRERVSVAMNLLLTGAPPEPE